jgi:alpha-1,3-rhamnosyl/mannosyltransferase
MRVLLNGQSAAARPTGIGWYTLRLGQALEALDCVETVGVAIGGRTVSLSEAVSQPLDAVFPLKTLVRSAARTILPVAGRQLMWNLASRGLRRQADRWSVFHETNYIAPAVAMPLVTTVCDLSYVRHPEFMPSHRRRWLRAYLGKRLAESRAIISISRFTTDELTACFPWLDRSRVFTTPLGVDHREFHPCRTTDEDRRLRAKYQLPPRFALYLGTLEPRKNVQGLLRGYARLPQRWRQEFPLVLAGSDGWLQSYFRDLVRDLHHDGSLRTVGYVPQVDVPGLLRAASVFCFPSLYEGFGLPPLEAAACGTAVVCGHGSSLPQVMGDVAEYVDPLSPESITAGLLRVLKDEDYRESLAARGPAHAAGFTWRRCAEQTLEAYVRAA